MSGLFCWYDASSQLTKVSYLLYYSILYLSYQADIPENINRNRPFHLSKTLFYSKNNHIYALNNIDINSYASQLKIIRKVPFLRVYNLLLIRILKNLCKKGAQLGFKRALVRPQKGTYCKAIRRLLEAKRACIEILAVKNIYT